MPATTLWATSIFTPPTIEWSRQLGSNGHEYSKVVTIDHLGNVFSAGRTDSDIDGAGPESHAGHIDGFVSRYDSAGTFLWTRQIGTNEFDEANHATADGLGNVYVSGSTRGDFDGPGPGTSGPGDAFLSKYDASGNLVWNRQWGSSQRDIGNVVETDGQGNFYVTGFTEGDLDGTGPGISASFGVGDAFLTKYDASGNILWSQQWGTSVFDASGGVTFDSMGNIYVSGITHGDIDGAGPSTHAGGRDVFLSKFNNSGNLLWTRQWGTTESDTGAYVTSDKQGNLYVAGSTQGDLDGLGPETHAGGADAFLMKYDSSGNLLWTRQYGSSTHDSTGYLRFDGLGNIYISGRTNGDIDGAGPETHAGSSDAFLSKFDTSGNLLWIHQTGTSDLDNAIGVATDGMSNVYISGLTFGDIDGIGPGSHAGVGDAFLVKFHDPNAIPEPGTLGLMFVGIVSLAVRRFR